MTEQQLEELELHLAGTFQYGYEDPEPFIEWLLDDQWHGKREIRENFKRSVREILDVPGTVTPFIFRCWTNNYDLNTQEKVQKFFQKLWDACFEGKVIEDWELDGENDVPPDEAQT